MQIRIFDAKFAEFYLLYLVVLIALCVFLQAEFVRIELDLDVD
jgi:hypothetical protein